MHLVFSCVLVDDLEEILEFIVISRLRQIADEENGIQIFIFLRIAVSINALAEML